jgi:hypothetical protein
VDAQLLCAGAQLAALERAEEDPARRQAVEELAARRDALDRERRAVEEEEERLRAAVAAAAAGRDEAEARRQETEADLVRARSEVEAAREKDSLVRGPPTLPVPRRIAVCFSGLHDPYC